MHELVRDDELRVSFADRLIKLDERPAKLDGTDAPQKVVRLAYGNGDRGDAERNPSMNDVPPSSGLGS